MIFGLELVENMLNDTVFIDQKADAVQAVIGLAHEVLPLEMGYDSRFDFSMKKLTLTSG